MEHIAWWLCALPLLINDLLLYVSRNSAHLTTDCGRYIECVCFTVTNSSNMGTFPGVQVTVAELTSLNYESEIMIWVMSLVVLERDCLFMCRWSVSVHWQLVEHQRGWAAMSDSHRRTDHLTQLSFSSRCNFSLLLYDQQVTCSFYL